MSFTPTNPRITNLASGLKLTPSSSPQYKPSGRGSPTKTNKQEYTLSLKQVIGTTTCTPSGFDCLSSGRCFAYTAGAAAVITSLDDEFAVAGQRFFRAKPALTGTVHTNTYNGPSTPTNPAHELRSRAAAGARDAGLLFSPNSATPDWIESPSGKTWSAKDRIKAATSLSISPDGKYLAVGETGYKPRVLVFSTSPELSSDLPLSCMSEHTHGVRCVAFSPDSQFLASLGAPTDGFLYLWSINLRNGFATLCASNRCTSDIKQMAWCGTNIITVGVRHIKVWRTDGVLKGSPSKPRMSEILPVSSPGTQMLAGRNCLLGPLLEATFTTVTAVSPFKAIICSDRGDVCLLDDSDGGQRFSKVATMDFPITAAALDGAGRLVVAGSQGSTKALILKDLLSPQTPPSSPAPREPSPALTLEKDATFITALGYISGCAITIDSRSSIAIISSDSSVNDTLKVQDTQHLPAHRHAVLGVSALPFPNAFEASFFTWSSAGAVLFWDTNGKSMNALDVEMEQPTGGDDYSANELKVVRAIAAGKLLGTGDKYGVLRLIDSASRQSTFESKAHASEIMDIVVHEHSSRTLVASCSRDRTIQIFQGQLDGWELIQTTEDHVSAVSGLLFTEDGSQLLSCSADRTVIIRDAIKREEDGKTLTAFIITRTITLRNTPTAMMFDSIRPDMLILATSDRQLHKYDLQSGHAVMSFKTTDADAADPVVMTSIAQIKPTAGSSIIAGIASTDKSLRVYDDYGTCLARDYGHTEGVTGIAVVKLPLDDGQSEGHLLITVAIDGTIFLWDFRAKSVRSLLEAKTTDSLSESTLGKDLIASKPPLRRVLSHSELMRFRGSPESESTPTFSTPTGARSPRLKKKTSRYSLAQTPRLDPSPSLRSAFQPTLPSPEARRNYRNRSPSPPSPRQPTVPKARRPSIDATRRTRSSITVPSSSDYSTTASMHTATETFCRALRTYRRKLLTTSETLSPEALREVEQEMAKTAKLIGEKARKTREVSNEAVMERFLEQYSERFVERLDEKILERIGVGRQRSEGDVGKGRKGEGGERSSSVGEVEGKGEEKGRSKSAAGLGISEDKIKE